MTQPIRVGRVSAVDYPKGVVRVFWPDMNSTASQNTSTELPMLSFLYNMPQVNDLVLSLHLSSGEEKAVVLGRYWGPDNLPPESGPHIWRMDFDDGAFMRYDRDAHRLTIEAEHIEFSGDVSVSGDVIIGGSLTVSGRAEVAGDATISDIPYKTHVHKLPGSEETTEKPQ